MGLLDFAIVIKCFRSKKSPKYKSVWNTGIITTLQNYEVVEILENTWKCNTHNKCLDYTYDSKYWKCSLQYT